MQEVQNELSELSERSEEQASTPADYIQAGLIVLYVIATIGWAVNFFVQRWGYNLPIHPWIPVIGFLVRPVLTFTVWLLEEDKQNQFSASWQKVTIVDGIMSLLILIAGVALYLFHPR